MDTTLLRETRTPVPQAPERNGPQPTDEVTNYRDLPVEPPQPALRLRLDPPLDYDGQAYRELIFDFDSLIGKDFQHAERTFNKLYKAEKNEVVMPEMKHLFHCILAAQVADVPVGLIMKLPRRYYTPLRLEVLKACGSSPDEENE